MKISTSLVSVAAALVINSATAAIPGQQPLPRKSVYQSTASRNNVLNRLRNKAIANEASDKAYVKHRSGLADDIKPVFELPSTDKYGDLDGPNGEMWYYTANFTYEYEQINEYWTDYFLRHYVFSVYNAAGELVGTVEDDMHYAEDEVRVPYVDLLPVVTKKFFNDDDNYEVAVGLAVNSTTPGINHYRTVAYSLGGVKDDNGNDAIVATLPDMVSDVLDASADGGEERHLMTVVVNNMDFSDGEDYEDETAEEFWQRQLSYKSDIIVYDKVNSDGTPHEIMRHTVQQVCMPGEQEDTPYFMSLKNGHGCYFVFARYKDPLYNPYASASDPDMSQRESNSLIIEIYKLNGDKFDLSQTTEYPFTKDNAEDVIASYYSIGNFRYTDDVIFNADGNADFYLMKQNKHVGNDETFTNSYYYVKADGTIEKTVFENCSNAQMLSSVAGQPDQCMFVTYDNGYLFHFVDLPDAREVASMSNMFMIDDFSDPEYILANCDRTPFGDSYRYAFEMRMPDEDEHGLKMRIAWFDEKCRFIDYEYVNMGLNVQYAVLYLDGKVLQPDFYYKDDEGKREYMLLLKREVDGVIEEQLLIGQALGKENPEGQDIRLFTPDSEKGALSSIIVYALTDTPHLNIGYVNTEYNATTTTSSYALEVYNMPFNKRYDSSVNQISIGNAVKFDGSSVTADGIISIYDICGLKVATGINSVSVESLQTGVYVVSAAGETCTIFVK